MKTILESAKELAYQIMERPKHVGINYGVIDDLIEKINKSTFPNNTWDIPIELDSDEHNANKQIILYDLIASLINFKYWYGKHDIRPSDSSSTKLYDLLTNVFKRIPFIRGNSDMSSLFNFNSYAYVIIRCFITDLSTSGMPMISERTNNLEELLKPYNGPTVHKLDPFINCFPYKYDIDLALENLIRNFPNFAQDLFLKRASLFFMMLYRRKKWFKNELNKLVIPADYHIPKMLKHYGCIFYTPELNDKIRNAVLIPEGSLEECEIRAASIVVAEEMNKKGINPVQVDDFLWVNRKECSDPFHLTISTNY